MDKTNDKRKFTLYLNGDEDIKLVQLRGYLGENTDAKAIKTAITKYQGIVESHKKMSGYLNDERAKNMILERRIKNFSSAFKELLKD